MSSTNNNSNEGNIGGNQDENQQEPETRNNNADVQIPSELGEVSLSTSHASILPDVASAGGGQAAAPTDADIQIGDQSQVQEQQAVARARSRSTSSSKSNGSKKMQVDVDTADDIKRLKRESNSKVIVSINHLYVSLDDSHNASHQYCHLNLIPFWLQI